MTAAPLKIRLTFCKEAAFCLAYYRAKLEIYSGEGFRKNNLRELQLQALGTAMNNLLFDYDHPTLRVFFVSTIIILGLLIINDLIPWGALGRRTRRRGESNLVLIILAILALAVEWAVYMFL